MDQLRAGRAGPFEQHERAVDVRLDELRGAEDRAVDMGLGGEVHDRFTALGGHCHGVGVRDVALEQLDVGSVEIPGIARVRELVEDDDLVAGGNEALDEVAADEAAAAGHEYAHSADSTD